MSITIFWMFFTVFLDLKSEKENIRMKLLFLFFIYCRCSFLSKILYGQNKNLQKLKNETCWVKISDFRSFPDLKHIRNIQRYDKNTVSREWFFDFLLFSKYSELMCSKISTCRWKTDVRFGFSGQKT